MARKLKCNGCGPRWFPNWARIKTFEQQCNRHDVDYHYGIDRTQADIDFFIKMLKKCHDSRWRRGQVIIAIWMYTIVWMFGWIYFNWSANKTHRKALLKQRAAKMANKTEGQDNKE